MSNDECIKWLTEIKNKYVYSDPYHYAIEIAINALSAQPEVMYYPQVDGVTPSVIVQPERKKGKWEMKWHHFFKREVPTCSVCKAGNFFKTKFCPNCGADMREGKQ